MCTTTGLYGKTSGIELAPTQTVSDVDLNMTKALLERVTRALVFLRAAAELAAHLPDRHSCSNYDQPLKSQGYSAQNLLLSKII